MPDRTDVNHRFHRMLVESSDYLKKQREDADRAWDFRDGVQWTEAEEAELSLRHQQSTVVNICRPIINMFAAIERNSRTDYTVVGRERADDPVADVLTVLIKQIYNNTNFPYFLSQGAKDGGIGGIGWFEVGVEEDMDMSEELVQIWLRPWEEFWYDPHARRPDLTDARYICRQIWMDRDIAIYQYPEAKDELESEYSDDYFAEFQGQEKEAQLQSDNSMYMDGTGKSRRISINEMYYRNVSGKWKHIIFSRNVFLVGSDSADDRDDAVNESPFKYNFAPFIPFIAQRDKKGRPVGLLKDIIPLNEMLNKALSKWMWNVSGNRVFHEAGAFVDPDEARIELAKPDCFVALNDGAIRDKKFVIEKALEESVHLMNMMQFIVQMAQRISGVNDALIGVGGNNARSAQQESSRVAQGSAMQTPVIENLYFTKLQITRSILKLIGQFYTKEKVVRITGIDGDVELVTVNGKDAEGKPFNKIEDILAYDIELKEELPFTTVREATNKALAEVMKSFPPLAQVLIIPFLENLPIANKEELVKRAKTIFDQQLDQQQQGLVNEQFQAAGLKPLAA